MPVMERSRCRLYWKDTCVRDVCNKDMYKLERSLSVVDTELEKVACD